MPNHIRNVVTIKNHKAEEIRQRIGNGEGDVFIDFNKITPMPKELENTQSPAMIVSELDFKAEMDKYEVEKAKPKSYASKPITQKMSDDYIERFGANDWYDWSCKNWGTKWNAYEQSGYEDTIEFNTAWATPVPIIKALSELYKGDEVEVKYADEDMGSNCGTYTFLNGEQIESEDKSELDRVGALKFACEVWGNDYENDYDEEGNYKEDN